jgi:hypothetical protein
MFTNSRCVIIRRLVRCWSENWDSIRFTTRFHAAVVISVTFVQAFGRLKTCEVFLTVKLFCTLHSDLSISQVHADGFYLHFVSRSNNMLFISGLVELSRFHMDWKDHLVSACLCSHVSTTTLRSTLVLFIAISQILVSSWEDWFQLETPSWYSYCPYIRHRRYFTIWEVVHVRAITAQFAWLRSACWR